MNNRRVKVLIVSIDGATWDIIRPFIEKGLMPNLRRLMQQGVAAPLASTVPPSTPVAWTSFMTGKNPGKHGILDFRLYDPKIRSDAFANSTFVRTQTLWQILSNDGVRVGVVNLPVTYPPYPVNGFLVSGFDTPSLDSLFTYPPELRKDILSKFPSYEFVCEAPESLHNSDTDFVSYTEMVKGMLRLRTTTALYLVQKYTPDVVMVQYQSLDALQHCAWRYLDPGLAEREPVLRRAAVESCYREMDKCISSLVDCEWMEGANVFVISDHGFGPWFGSLYPNVWLERWGYLCRQPVPKEPVIVRIKRFLRDSLLGAILILLYGYLRVIIDPLRKRLVTRSTFTERMQRATIQSELPLDWKRTVALVASAEHTGSLYLNGIEKAEERQLLLTKLEGRFRELVDSTDNIPWFNDVLLGEVAYDIDNSARQVPDLILVPREGWAVSRQLPNNDGVQRRSDLWGTHRPDGIIVAAGPNIKAGNIGHPSLIDMAPTILHLLCLPVPSDMDGKVLTSMLTVESPVRYIDSGPVSGGEPSKLSESEEEAILKRLRTLGYLSKR